MGPVVAAILILSGTIAWAAAAFLQEAAGANSPGPGIVLWLLGLAEFTLGLMALRTHERANRAPK